MSKRLGISLRQYVRIDNEEDLPRRDVLKNLITELELTNEEIETISVRTGTSLNYRIEIADEYQERYPYLKIYLLKLQIKYFMIDILF